MSAGTATAHVVGSDVVWPAEFEDFYRRHFAGLVRMAAAMLDRPDVAEEVTQDALLGLAEQWDDVDAPYGYVRRSVVNASHDHLRRLRHQRRYLQSQRAQDRVVAPPEIAEVSGLLDRLSPRRQVALALRFYEDLEYAEIAELMDCRQATVRSLIHRGLKQLRRRMS